MKQNKRRQVAKISVFITSIFVIFLSITYAFINMTVTGTKRQVITAGNLQIELEEENAITLTNAMPMYDEVGMIQDAFTFRLKNTGTTSVNYIVKLVDITTGDKLDTSIVKYGLTKDETSTIKYLSNLVNGQIGKGVINGNQTIEYSLRLWIDSEVTDNNQISGKSLSYRVNVETTQKIQISYKGMMKAREEVQVDEHAYDVSYTDYYAYSDSISSIEIENRINIPETIVEDKKWDMSVEQDESVMAYIEENGTLESGEVAYKLHIQAKGKVIANENSGALFYDFPELLTINGLESLDLSYVNRFYSEFMNHSIFKGCPKLNLDLSKLDTSKVTNMSYMFSNYSSNQSLDLSKLNTSNVTDMSHMFQNCRSLTSLDLSNFNTSNVTDMSHMFAFSNIQSLDLSHLDTSQVTNMSYMFSYYRSSQPLDLSYFDTSKVTDMSEMFSGYSSNQPLDLSNFDTSKVTNMSYMFSDYSSSQPLDLSPLDTSNVTNMSGMFSNYSSSQPLDLSSFDTSKVTTIYRMFSGCSGLTSLDLSSFDTSKVTDMSYMFTNCNSLTSLNISSFDTSKVTNMSSIFFLVKNDCLITVKDDAMVNWVKGINSSLTNVQVKSA